MKTMFSTLISAILLSSAVSPVMASGLTQDTPSGQPTRTANGSAFATADGGLFFCKKGMPTYDEYPLVLCHTVRQGETLWGISRKYLGSGFAWKQWYVAADEPSHWLADGTWIPNPRRLQPGTVIAIGSWAVLEPQLGYTEGTLIRPGSNDIVANRRIAGSNQHALYINRVFYDGWYRDISHIAFSADGKNLSYVGGDWKGKQFIVNGVKNPHVSVGCDWKLLTYSPSGKHYAIRNNKDCVWGTRSSADSFVVLSDIGNGKEYDYADSLMWVDDTLVYRALKDGAWRIVVDHEDQPTYKYVDALRVENGVLKFQAQHEDGTMTEERLDLKGYR